MQLCLEDECCVANVEGSFGRRYSKIIFLSCNDQFDSLVRQKVRQPQTKCANTLSSEVRLPCVSLIYASWRSKVFRPFDDVFDWYPMMFNLAFRRVFLLVLGICVLFNVVREHLACNICENALSTCLFRCHHNIIAFHAVYWTDAPYGLVFEGIRIESKICVNVCESLNQSIFYIRLRM